MRSFLLDTDIIIDVLRGVQTANKFINGLDDINISIFTALELLDGCKDKKSLNNISKLFEKVSMIYSTDNRQKVSLSVFTKFKLSNGLGLIDSLIAGIAIENDFVLVTRNLKYFEFIEDLKVYVPY